MALTSHIYFLDYHSPKVVSGLACILFIVPLRIHLQERMSFVLNCHHALLSGVTGRKMNFSISPKFEFVDCSPLIL